MRIARFDQEVSNLEGQPLRFKCRQSSVGEAWEVKVIFLLLLEVSRIDYLKFKG